MRGSRWAASRSRSRASTASSTSTAISRQGYQLTQFYQPLARSGVLQLTTDADGVDTLVHIPAGADRAGHRQDDLFFFFFLFIHYSCATYGDHDEIMYSPFPVRCPRSGGSMLAPCLPSAQAYPKKFVRTKEMTQGKGWPAANRKKRPKKSLRPSRLDRSCGRHEVRRG